MFTVQHPCHQGICLSISQQSLRGSKQGRQVITDDLPSTLLLHMIHNTYLGGENRQNHSIKMMEGSDGYNIQLKPDIDDIQGRSWGLRGCTSGPCFKLFICLFTYLFVLLTQCFFFKFVGVQAWKPNNQM